MVPLYVTPQTSLALVEFLERGGVQPVQREASGFDQQPDWVGAVVSQAEQDALASVLRCQVGFHGVFGIPQQPQQQVLRADLLVAGDRLVGGDVQGAPAQQRRGVGAAPGPCVVGLSPSACLDCYVSSRTIGVSLRALLWSRLPAC